MCYLDASHKGCSCSRSAAFPEWLAAAVLAGPRRAASIPLACLVDVLECCGSQTSHREQGLAAAWSECAGARVKPANSLLLLLQGCRAERPWPAIAAAPIRLPPPGGAAASLVVVPGAWLLHQVAAQRAPGAGYVIIVFGRNPVPIVSRNQQGDCHARCGGAVLLPLQQRAQVLLLKWGACRS